MTNRKISLMLMAVIAVGCGQASMKPEPQSEYTPVPRAPNEIDDVFGRSVEVEAYDEDGKLVALGSGVVIDDGWVATAAHVVHGQKEIRTMRTVLEKKRCRQLYDDMEIAAMNPGQDVAILRRKGPAAEGHEWKRGRVPMATFPLKEQMAVVVHTYAPGTADRIWHGGGLDELTIDIALEPGSSGAGVYVVGVQGYALVGLVSSRTDLPAKELARISTRQGDGIVNVITARSARSVTDLVPVQAVRDLMETVRK